MNSRAKQRTLHPCSLVVTCVATLALAGGAAGQLANTNCSFGLIPTPSPGGIVMAMEVFDGGSGPELFLGYSSPFGNPQGDPVRWTGSGFAPVGNSTLFGVLALKTGTLSGSPQLFAGFTGQPAIRSWNGSAWNNLGSGLALLSPSHPFESVGADALAVCNVGSGPRLYVAGRFDRAGGLAAPGLASWDGANWSALPSPGGRVRDMLAFDDGSGERLFCATDVGLKIWNGMAWSGTGLNTQSLRLCLYDSGSGPSLYAASRFGGPGVGFWDVGRWNGTSWTRTNLPYPEFDVHAPLASYDDGNGAKLYTVVDMWIGSAGRRLARFDGATWSEVGSPPNAFSFPVRDLQAFNDVSGPSLFIGGEFQQAFGQAHAFFVRYGCTGQLPPTNFCTPAPTQQGCIALVAASSHPSATLATACSITATGVDAQRNGLLLYGINGQSSSVWCAGSTNLLCVAAPRQRMTALNSGGVAGSCNGVLAQDWNAFQLANPGALGAPWTAGVAVEIQGWFRDPSACRGSSLSQGVRVFVQP